MRIPDPECQTGLPDYYRAMCNTVAMRSIPTEVLIAMAAMFFSAAASAGSGGFFFDSGTPAPRPRAAFQAEQREQILADAYACNRPDQSPDERERCKAKEVAAKQAVLDRTTANHQAAEPQRMEMRRLYERMSPLQR
jgi:hypothetical protein